MKLEIPIIVDIDNMESLIEDLGHLQTYKLFEGADQILVDVDDVIEVFKNHVEVRRKKKASGHWEQKFSPAYKGGGYTECSNCKYSFSIGAYFEAETWKYCPECGARMKGDEIDC